MTDDILKRINKDNLDKSVEMLKSKLGPAESAKVDATLNDTKKLDSLISGLGKKEQDMIVRMLNDPKAMKMLLSSPKVAELVKQFLNK